MTDMISLSVEHNHTSSRRRYHAYFPHPVGCPPDWCGREGKAAMISCRNVLICLLLFGGCLGGCQPNTPQSAGSSLSVPFQTHQWNTGYATGQELVTQHYRIYTTVHRGNLLAVLPGFCEAGRQNYLNILDLTVPSGRQMSVYMLATRAEWADLTQRKFGRDGPAMTIEDGGYTYKGVTVCWDIGGMATFAIVSHEGMHQFLYYNLRNRLPLWAEEGLASTAEGFVLERNQVRFTPDINVIRLANLREAILNDYWLPLKTLLTTNTKQVARRRNTQKTVGYYGQLYALMSFLRSHPSYRLKWRNMLSDALTGRFGQVLTPPELRLRGQRYHRAVDLTLFRYYISTDLDAFEREFYAFARQLVKLPPDSMRR